MVDDERIREILMEQEDLEGAVYSLVEEANDRGGKDNVTVIVVKVLARTSKQVALLTQQAAKA